MTYAITVLASIIVSWVLLGCLRDHYIRILLRTGCLAACISPAFYFNDGHIVFVPALVALMISPGCALYTTSLIAGIAAILIFWSLFAILGFLFYRQKPSDIKKPSNGNIMARLITSLFKIFAAVIAIAAILAFAFLFTPLGSSISPALTSMKGYTLVRLGQDERALDLFDKLTNSQPDMAWAWQCKGLTLAKLERFTEALDAFNKTIELQPDNAGAWACKGRLFCNFGNFPEALDALDEAIELQPDDAFALLFKGNALLKLGRYDEARAAYDRVIELRPDDVWAWYNKACVFALTNDTEKSLKYLTKALKLDPKAKEQAKTDSDLDSLRGNPEFRKLVD